MTDHDPTTRAPADGVVPDWRSDTVERRSPLVADAVPDADETTHALPPVRLPVAGPHDTPAEMPRAARWPLWADGGPDLAPRDGASAATPAERVPSARTAVARRLPLTAAVVAVAVVLGSGGVWLLTPDEPASYPRTVVGDPDFLDPGVADGPPAGSVGDTATGLRPDGASRGSERDDESDGATGGRGGATDGPEDVIDVEAVRSRATSVVDRVRPSASVTAPPNESLTGERTTYGARNLVDGRTETAWRMPGNGRGEVITLRLDRPTTLTSVGLLNGYAKTDRARGRTVDWYAANRRVRTVEWFFDDGSRVTQSLRQDRRMQTTDIEPVTTSVVRLRIAEVSPPGRGRDGRDFTALSEVALDGVPARG